MKSRFSLSHLNHPLLVVSFLLAGVLRSQAQTSTNTIASAVNCSNVVWTTGGDTSWFVETNTTYDGLAMESGVVTNGQASVLTATALGPGAITFYWASQINGAAYCEFDIDGNFQDILYGDSDWYQDGVFNVSDGQHALTWTFYANGDDDPTEAVFLDEVNYTSFLALPVTLTNVTDNGTNLSFSFPSQAGFTNTVQYKTNLLAGSWQVYTNVVGNGSVMTVNVPLSIFGGASNGFVRIHP